MRVAEPRRAASDLAFLLFREPLDCALFHPGETPEPDVDALVDHAVSVVLAAHVR